MMKLINKFLRFLRLQNRPLKGKELEDFQKAISPALTTWGYKDDKAEKA